MADMLVYVQNMLANILDILVKLADMLANGWTCSEVCWTSS